jgi:hypothetical protein
MNANQKAEALALTEWLRWFVRNVQDPTDFRWTRMSEAADTIESLLAEPASAQQWRDQLRELVDELAVKDQRIAALEAQPAPEPYFPPDYPLGPDREPASEQLTDEEIDAIPFDCDPDVMDSILSESLRKFARAVLKAQKEKQP